MVNDKIVNKVLSQPNLIVFYKAFYLNLLKENGNEDDSNLYNAELQQLLHDFKSRNGDERL